MYALLGTQDKPIHVITTAWR